MGLHNMPKIYESSLILGLFREELFLDLFQEELILDLDL
jgi:hypothetical protein